MGKTECLHAIGEDKESKLFGVTSFNSVLTLSCEFFAFLRQHQCIFDDTKNLHGDTERKPRKC